MPWGVIGPWAGWAAFLSLAFIIVRAFISGDVLSRRTVERELNQAREETERARHDAAEWRTQTRIQDSHIAEQHRQLTLAGEAGGLTVRVAEALQQVTGIDVDHGDGPG